MVKAWDLEAGDMTLFGTVTDVYRYSEYVDVRFNNHGQKVRKNLLRDEKVATFTN